MAQPNVSAGMACATKAMWLQLAVLTVCSTMAQGTAAFDVLQHLSTKTPYASAVPAVGSRPAELAPDPPGYRPVYLHLLARHGTRWPTAKRMRQIAALQPLLQAAVGPVSKWASNWSTPFPDAALAGQLHPTGELEMQQLGARFRRRLPGLFGQPYGPPAYPITSTQVPRTSASAMAFAQGAFPCAFNNRTSNGCRPQPVAISMQPKHADPLLRFWELCPAYIDYVASTAEYLVPFLEGVAGALAGGVAQRLGVAPGQVGAAGVEALWQLCQAEAGVLGVTDRACTLFTPEEVAQLEWAHDVGQLVLKGHVHCDAYTMAAPLLAHIGGALAAAAKAEPEQQASLQFAHAETVIPLAALLGLFGSSGACSAPASLPQQQLLAEAAAFAGGCACGAAGGPCQQAAASLRGGRRMLAQQLLACSSSADDSSAGSRRGLVLPASWQPPLPEPPAPRCWTGATVAPSGANLAFVLYRRQAQPAGNGTSSSQGAGNHLLRVLYNEQAIPVPGCTPVGPEGYDCDLSEFLDNVAGSSLAPDAFRQACGV